MSEALERAWNREALERVLRMTEREMATEFTAVDLSMLAATATAALKAHIELMEAYRLTPTAGST